MALVAAAPTRITNNFNIISISERLPSAAVTSTMA